MTDVPENKNPGAQEWQQLVEDGERFRRMQGGPEKAALAKSLMERGAVGGSRISPEAVKAAREAGKIVR